MASVLGLPEVSDPEVNRALHLIEERLDNPPSPAFGAFVTVTLGATETKVRHTLGYKPLAWLIIDKDADARVWRSSASNKQFLPLTASAATTIKLWVF